MDDTKVRDFINFLADDETASTMKSGVQRSIERQFALSGLTEKLNKEEIRSGMTFSIKNSKGKEIHSFDKRGQEYAIDTYEATKDGRGISGEDQIKTQKAMDLVVEYVKSALALKTSDGRLVFDPSSPSFIQDVMDEVYTPLVREGILPENFVIDKYSEVYRLLKNTIKNYKGTLDESRKKHLMEEAEIESGLAGSRGKIAKAKAIGGKINQIKDRVVEKIGKETLENAMFAKDLASLGYATYKAGKDLQGWKGGMDSVNVKREDLFLNPEKALNFSDQEGAAKYGVDGWRYIKSTIGKDAPTEWDNSTGEKNYGVDGWNAIKRFKAGDISENDSDYIKHAGSITTYLDNAKDPDYLRGVLENAANMQKVDKTFAQITKLTGIDGNNPVLKKVRDLLAAPSSDAKAEFSFYFSSSVDLTQLLVESGIELGTLGVEVNGFSEQVMNLLQQESANDIAKSAVDRIESVVVSEFLSCAGKNASEAIEGLFESKIDESKLSSALSKEVNGAEFIMQVSAAVEKMLSTFTPEVATLGKSLAKSIRGKAKSSEFNDAYKKSPDSAVKIVVDAVGASIVDHKDRVSELFKHDALLLKITAEGLFGKDDAVAKAVLELEESDDEIREFEHLLVTIDDGGLSAAQQRSIEILIEEMERDRKVLEIVNSAGGALQGIGAGSMGIAGWATTEVTDVIVGQVVGPLKAAKLILEFAISVKKAAERWSLLEAFKVDLKRSKIAVSSLTSTIQGFYNNKKEQCAFRTVEQALLLVQIAAEVVGSVPTPITLAIGKTMSKVVGVAQKSAELIEKRYDHNMMKKAWNTTREAIENLGNRKLGLKALRLNPSLGMHAIAWAATELQPPDPIARMVLGSVGLNETTLAVSGTEDKVRTYLVNLLNEDRDLTDPSSFNFDAKLNTNWAPPLSLDLRCWAILTQRAARDASPKLELSDQEKNLHPYFLALEKFPSPKAIKEEGASEDLKPHLEVISDLISALRKYKPMSAGRIAHDDMENEVSKLLDLAIKHRDDVESIFLARQVQEARLLEMSQLSEWLDISVDLDNEFFKSNFNADEFQFHLDRFRPKCGATDQFKRFEEAVKKGTERYNKL